MFQEVKSETLINNFDQSSVNRNSDTIRFTRDSVVCKNYKRVSLVLSKTERVDLYNNIMLEVWNPKNKKFIIHDSQFTEEEKKFWIELIRK